MTTDILSRHAVASGCESMAFLSQVVNSSMLRSCLGVGLGLGLGLGLGIRG